MSKALPNNPTRALFIEQQKKHQKRFLMAVAEALVKRENRLKNSDVSWNLGVIRNVIENLTSPAKLWDTAQSSHLEIFWDAIGVCVTQASSELMNEITALNAVQQTVESTDYFELNQTDDDIASAAAAANACVAASFDDDDDDDYSNFPKILYHATPTKNIGDIMRDGLVPMARKNVYLWSSPNKALEVANRHGDSSITVFAINVKEFIDSGNHIDMDDFGYGDGLQYLTASVDPDYLSIVA